MPLLNGEPFIKQEPPSDLRPEEEVFFSPITFEVFRNYDDFFERTIQLNSMIWGCSFCGMHNLNYREALACEEGDRTRLAAFGVGLSRGLLHIMLHARRRRLADLVDVLLAFTTSRFFVGEELCLRRCEVTISSEPSVVVERVILPPPRPKSEDIENERPPTMPDPKLIKYVVRGIENQISSNSPTDSNPTLILPHSALHRPPQKFLTRDRIKSFIRQTGKLENQFFVPRESVIRYFNLYPLGSLKWADVFAEPDLPWSDIVTPRIVTGREKMLMVSRDGSNAATKRAGNASVTVKSIGISINNHSSSEFGTTNIHRLTRIERTDLERTWSLLRKRDDLDLSDLVPLPPLTPLRLRRFIPPEDFGVCLQVYEFFHVFGGLLHLPVPGAARQVVKGEAGKSPVVMEDEDEDGGGYDGITWEMLEDVLFSQDPMGPFADVLFGLLCAIRRLESETNSRQLPPTAEAAAASTVSAIATLEAGLPLASAGFLTGLGCSQEYTAVLADTLTTASGSVLAAIFHATAEATRQCELVGLAPIHSALTSRAERAAATVAVGGVSVAAPSEGGTSTGRSWAVRASALAVALGAASLPPLDRAGLAEALWLHISTAPAKTGGWRGSIWGGTRPLDDPCVDLMRSNREIVDKLRSVPLYTWPLSDRLALIVSLIDEVLLQPQLRERMEAASEGLRHLRLQLRGVQAERYKFYGGNANIANMLYGFSPSTLISTSDSWLTGTPPILRNSMNRPRKKTIEAAKAKIAAEFNCAKGGGIESDSQKAGLGADGKASSGAGLQLPPINSISAELEKAEHTLWQSVLRTARRFSMIPLGQDRIYRRYWLVPSLPAVLVEDTLQEASAFPLPFTSPVKAEGSALQVPIPAALRVRGRQVGAGTALGASAAEAARNLKRAIEQLCASAEMEDEHWQNPRLLDRDSLLSQLAIDLPANREALTLDQLKSLIHPARRGNAQVDIDHPAVVQVEELQKNSPRWSLLLPLPPEGRAGATEMDTKESRYAGGRRAIDQLEASLNPRGTRESHLRKAVCQLRPILITAVAECPVEVLAVPEEVKKEGNASLPTKDTLSILLAWLETAVHGVAMRLGVPLTKLEEGTKTMGMEDGEEADSSDEATNPSSDEPYQRQKFRQLAQMILALGNAVGPRRLAAPLSADDRSLRGALPSTASLASLDEVSTSSPSTPQTLSGFDMSTVGGATTGFQRWCNCVRSATTTAQLHLLLRALERSVRKANRGGRGVPAAIGSYATRFRLPEIRCTACRGPPDQASVSSGGAGSVVSAFCLCGGCACPFHQDCLLSSLSRQSPRSSSTIIRTNAYCGIRAADATSITALSCLYSLMPCHINTTAATRQDCLKGALLLCQRCRRLAGGCGEEAGKAEEEFFAEPLPDELLEAVELKEIIDEGGQAVEEENDNEEDGEVVEGLQDCEGETVDIDGEMSVKNRNITPTPTRGWSSPNGVPTVRRGHGRRSRGSFSLRSALGAGHRGRSAKRPRYLEDYEGDEMEESSDQFNNDTMGKKTKTEDIYVDEDVLYEDEMEAYDDLKPKNKARRGVLNSRVSRVSMETIVPRKRGRPSKVITAAPVRQLSSLKSVDTTVNKVKSESGEEKDGISDGASSCPIRSQQAAERLLAEVSALSAARPLLRCALSKTFQSEVPSEQSVQTQAQQRRRNSSRPRRSATLLDGSSPTKSPLVSGLLAYDLESLRDLLAQGNLPGGPAQVVSQLRLLTQHWTSSNRPGSRLHGCALDVSAFLEKRLQELTENRPT
ncbi:Bromodomain adjacent to zinc finger domain protein 1A [Echinococcus granulosus]|nr:Bromodomain adjacent to zinc finger domain protein 1A [Echinococcus granulosus]